MAEWTVDLRGGPHAGQWLVSDADDGYSWPLPEQIPAGDGTYTRFAEAADQSGASYYFESEICKHDLRTAQCAECRPRPPAAENAARWSGLAAAQENKEGFGPVFAARYAADCPSCGERWEIGDEIRGCDALGDFVGVACGCGAV